EPSENAGAIAAGVGDVAVENGARSAHVVGCTRRAGGEVHDVVGLLRGGRDDAILVRGGGRHEVRAARGVRVGQAEGRAAADVAAGREGAGVGAVLPVDRVCEVRTLRVHGAPVGPHKLAAGGHAGRNAQGGRARAVVGRRDSAVAAVRGA